MRRSQATLVRNMEHGVPHEPWWRASALSHSMCPSSFARWSSTINLPGAVVVRSYVHSICVSVRALLCVVDYALLDN
jgi:hypothetical protein